MWNESGEMVVLSLRCDGRRAEAAAAAQKSLPGLDEDDDSSRQAYRRRHGTGCSASS